MGLKKYVRSCVSLKKNKSQGKTVEVTVSSTEDNSETFCLDFVQEFGLRSISDPDPLRSTWSYIALALLGPDPDPEAMKSTKKIQLIRRTSS
jgi:hypothetical protein